MPTDSPIETHVYIWSHIVTIDHPLDFEEVVVIGTVPIVFPIDFGPLMDRWAGGSAVAKITAIDNDLDVYRVIDHEVLDVEFHQITQDSFALRSDSMDWILIIRSGEGNISVTAKGDLPSEEESRWRLFWAFLHELGYSRQMLHNYQAA